MSLHMYDPLNRPCLAVIFDFTENYIYFTVGSHIYSFTPMATYEIPCLIYIFSLP